MLLSVFAVLLFLFVAIVFLTWCKHDSEYAAGSAIMLVFCALSLGITLDMCQDAALVYPALVAAKAELQVLKEAIPGYSEAIVSLPNAASHVLSAENMGQSVKTSEAIKEYNTKKAEFVKELTVTQLKYQQKWRNIMWPWFIVDSRIMELTAD